MRIYDPNLTDQLTVLGYFPGSAQAAFPAQNVGHPHKTRVWRTTGSNASEYLTLDLGSAKSVTAFLVFAHTFLNTDTLLKIQANSSDSWSAPPFAQNLTWSAAAIVTTFASQSYRWWRFSFTKAAASDIREVGRLFLGTYLDLTEPPDWDGLKIEQLDLSEHFRTVGGPTYSNIRSAPRRISADFSTLADASKQQVLNLSNNVGTGTPFFLTIDPAGTNEVSETLYVKLSKRLTRRASGMVDSDLGWDCVLDMIEEL